MEDPVAALVGAVCPVVLPQKALASLDTEPTEFAKGVEVLDSIVKVYTVYSR
jgi:hypothetical protein